MKALLRFLAVIAFGCILTGTVSAENTGTKEPAQPSAAVKPPDTLMFSIDELNEIQSRAATIGQNKSDEKKNVADSIENATLYLSTIMYYGPNDWTVWVNGVPISPGQEFQSFQITDIKPNYIELTVPLSAQGMRPVRLSPNQTFIVASGTVVEGPWR